MNEPARSLSCGADEEPSEICPVSSTPQAISGLDAFRNAREIVRLIQCLICSLPLRSPMTLPCGNSICRPCLPPMHLRHGISYPNTPGRQQGFCCPFRDCGHEHPLADCGVDFTLKNVMEKIEREFTNARLAAQWDGRSAGRLVNTYRMAKDGMLRFDADPPFSETFVDDRTDREVLRLVKEAAGPEMECLVCYNLLFDPITTHCGHTFCRSCLQQNLDHSPLCPTCRQRLQVTSVLPRQSSNKRVTEILVGLCPDTLAQRAAAISLEDKPGSADDEDLDTPIFVCAASFPTRPTALYIFEPRYRLMIRRAWENNRQFGMVLGRMRGVAQPELDDAPFMQYGTMLDILHMEVRPDGTSNIWTVGVSKFKIRRWGRRDEYVVANVERVDDLPIAEEEALEALQTSQPIQSQHLPSVPPWNRLPTAGLLRICQAFVERMEAAGAHGFRSEDYNIFGAPPQDPAVVPYWFASVFPVIAAEHQYALIRSTSVRERLLIAVGWVKQIENDRWLVVPSSSSSSSSSSGQRGQPRLIVEPA